MILPTLCYLLNHKQHSDITYTFYWICLIPHPLFSLIQSNHFTFSPSLTLMKKPLLMQFSWLLNFRRRRDLWVIWEMWLEDTSKALDNLTLQIPIIKWLNQVNLSRCFRNMALHSKNRLVVIKHSIKPLKIH